MKPTPEKQRPVWLIGLLIAIVLFVIGLVVVNLLGYGDDPVIGAFIHSPGV